jgi:hypothetical protein
MVDGSTKERWPEAKIALHEMALDPKMMGKPLLM